MNNKIEAPFTDNQVNALNHWQEHTIMHPFTCCSPENIPECKRARNEGETWEEKEGILVATKDGWVCPCGKYTQKWAHDFMVNFGAD